MFPMKPKPKDKSKPGSTSVDDAMAGMSIKSGRSSADRTRPPTASSSTRSKASQASSDAPRSSESSERIAQPSREVRPRPPGQVQYRAAENHRAAPAGYAENGARRPAQAPTMQQAHAHLHGPPPVRSNSAEPRRNGAYGAPPVMPNDPLQHPPQRAMTMPQTAANNVPANNVPQFEAQWPEPGPVAGYHGPASPTYIPPRPPTASSNYSGRNGTARQAEHYQPTVAPPELDGSPLPQSSMRNTRVSASCMINTTIALENPQMATGAWELELLPRRKCPTLMLSPQNGVAIGVVTRSRTI